MIELMIQVFIEVRITYSNQRNQLPAVQLYLLCISHLLPPSQGEGKMIYLCQCTLFYAEFIVTHLKKNIDRKIGKQKNRKQKNSFLQKIKMISAVIGAFKRPAEIKSETDRLHQ